MKSSFFKAPKEIESPCKQMTRTFHNYDAYKTEASPAVSKVDFQKFLSKVT